MNQFILPSCKAPFFPVQSVLATSQTSVIGFFCSIKQSLDEAVFRKDTSHSQTKPSELALRFGHSKLQ